jgi:alpha-beta hydrolase superfamily lysophospholipase
MLNEAPTVGLRPRGFILASPIVQVEDKLPRWQEWALRLGAALLPGLRIDLQSLAPDNAPAPQVVSNTTHEDQLSRTPHAVTRFSLRLLEEIRRLVRHNQQRAPKTTLPVLLLYGGLDVFTAPEEVERFFQRLGSPDKTQHFYPLGYHLLLHDVDQAAVLSEIDRWIDRLLRHRTTQETALSGK